MRIESSQPESLEAAVARAALEIPGVTGSILFEVGEAGGQEAVAAAGAEPIEESADPPEADPESGSPGPPLLSVAIPRWGTGPAHRLVLTLGPGTSPDSLLDDVERYARLAAPYLAAGSSERRREEALRRLERVERELATSRTSSRVAHVDALLGRIASRICAELSDPLGSVLGCARTLSETEDEKTRTSLVDDLLDSSSRGARIVEHLAAVSALEAAGDWGPFAPRPVLLEAAEEVRRERKAGVEIRVGSDLPMIPGSRDLLRLSLVIALRAMSGDEPASSATPVTFEAERTEGGLLVRMRRGDAPVKSDPHGSQDSRLGAWIAEEIWKELGARVEAKLGPEGPGFSVQFPAVVPEVESKREPR
ncbi:MAG: hypothetical protein L0323_02625 [Planctomycetes bacterium]|nr:hypothetical protein [Planctomycetota bacterium]